MTANPLRGFRLKMFRALQLLAPEGSSLDAVFSSYDDWRRFRASQSSETPAHSSEAKPVAAAPASVESISPATSNSSDVKLG